MTDSEPEVFNLYEKEWFLASNMKHIKKGRMDLIPLECLTSQYLLIFKNMCYYICVGNEDTCDYFEVYEIDLANPEDDCKSVDMEMRGQNYLQFMRQKILVEGYDIYIPERQCV